MILFDKDKLQLLAGLNDKNKRWLITEGEKDSDVECDCDGKCICAQPSGFTKFDPAAAENDLADLTEAELREFIKNEIVVQTKKMK